MNFSIEATCPLCGHDNLKNLLDLETGNFDQSTLYNEIRIRACLNCGHVFNALSQAELSELVNYYLAEKKPTNQNSQDKTGDLPGSNNPLTISRYEKLFAFLKDYLSPEAEILDLGFCQGGFINFLKTRGYQNLTDLDIVDTFLGKKDLLGVLPFADQSLDFIAMDQAIEHLHNPREALRELRRVMKPGALLYLGIPDASRYAKNNFFDFFWFLLREHIQHFDLTHLQSLVANEQFGLIAQLADDTVMMNERMLLPNLHALFQLGAEVINLPKQTDYFSLLSHSELYISKAQAKLAVRQEFFSRLSESKQAIYIWGMGREFLYLYEAAGLKHCNIAGLIDTNPFKQAELTIDGRSVQSGEMLRRAAAGDSLLITAIAHVDSIQASLRQQNYQLNYLKLD